MSDFLRGKIKQNKGGKFSVENDLATAAAGTPSNDGELLKAIEIHTGISDSRFSELVSGELEKGVKLVSGTTKNPDGK